MRRRSAVLLFGLSLLCVVSPAIATLPTSAIGQSGDRLEQARQQYDRGQLLDAAQTLNQAEQAFRTAKDGSRQAIALLNLSRVQFELGQMQAALTAAEQAETLYKQLGDRAAATRSRLQQAEILKARGDNNRAIALLLKLRQTLTAPVPQLEQAQVLRLLADALLAQDKVLTETQESPETLLQQSLQIATNLNDRAEMSAIAYSLAEADRVKINRTLYADIRNGSTIDRKLDAALVGFPQPQLIPSVVQSVELAHQQYQAAIALAPTPIVAAQAQLRQLRLLIETAQVLASLRTEAANASEGVDRLAQLETEITRLSTTILTLTLQLPAQLEALPLSAASVAAQINFATLLMPLDPGRERANEGEFSLTIVPPPLTIARQGLIAATQQAKQLQNPGLAASALSSLASLYVQTQQWSIAQSLNQQALQLVQQSTPRTIAALQSQAAQILEATGDVNQAIAACRASVSNLQAERQNLVVNNRDVQSIFLEQVEPTYRRCVRLLLRSQSGTATTQEHLREAIDLIDSLQVAELNDFFQEACLDDRKVAIDQLVERTPNTAFLFPILVSPQELGVIVKIPGKKGLDYHATQFTDKAIAATIKTFRDRLRQPSLSADQDTEKASNSLYQAIILPFNAQLKAANVQTLVFVLDSVLRDVPMAALYDSQSERYLIQDYAIALNATSQLTFSSSDRGRPTTIAAGLIKVPERYSLKRLESVAQEMQFLQKTGLLTRPALLEEAFTSAKLTQALNTSPFSNVLHLATHGKFSSRKEDTSVLMADGRIGVDKLSEILRSREQNQRVPIDLLVLSACETAEGDSRSTLGLAGIAVRSGVRSTIGSLWQVNDASTPELMGQFYNKLQGTELRSSLSPSKLSTSTVPTPRLSKAQALQQAQITLLLSEGRFAAPHYWAPFVLVGDWL